MEKSALSSSSERRGGTGYLWFGLALFAVLVGAAIFVSIPSEKERVVVTLDEASLDFFEFAVALALGPTQAGGVQCSEAGVCNSALPTTGAEKAWLLPAYFKRANLSFPAGGATGEQGLGSDGKSAPSPREIALREYAKEKNNLLHYQLNWLVLEAALAAKDLELLDVYLNGVLVSYLQARGGREMVGKAPMEVAQFLVPLFRFMRLEGMEGAKELLTGSKVYGIINPEVIRGLFAEYGEGIFSGVIKAGGTPNGRLFSDTEELNADACWVTFMAAEGFLATGNKRYKDYLDFFFSEARFESRGTDEMTYGSSMNALACVASFRGLGRDETFGARAQVGYQSMASSLLRSYDSPKRRICDGDGSLVVHEANPQIRDRCSNLLKSVADNAWAASLFAGDKTQVALN